MRSGTPASQDKIRSEALTFLLSISLTGEHNEDGLTPKPKAFEQPKAIIVSQPSIQHAAVRETTRTNSIYSMVRRIICRNRS